MLEAKKRCELCSNPARMFCDSDEASLCWDCDEKVHAANFLVAKHSRTLLCHVCQSPTRWSAAGPNLGRTVSVCHVCVDRRAASASRRGEEDACDSPESESVDDGEYYSESDDFSEEEEEAEGENQVVPWSDSASKSPPPHAMAANCSGSGDNVSFSSSKRTRENDYESEDEDGICSSPNMNSDENYSCSVSLLPAQKMQRRSSDGPLIPSEEEAAAGEEARCFSGTAAIVESLRRFGKEKRDEMIHGLCKLTGD